MRSAERRAIILAVIALALCAVQAGAWIKATAHTSSLTDVQNREGQHPTTDVPGIAGLCLLVVADIVACTAPEIGE
jgi:hypothetical protein